MDFLRLYLGEIVSLVLALLILFAAGALAVRYGADPKISQKHPQPLHSGDHRGLRRLLDLFADRQPCPPKAESIGPEPIRIRRASKRGIRIRRSKRTNIMRTKTILLLPALLLCGCTGPAVRSIPAGYMGKVLTPTGWEQSTHAAGQVDLRSPDRNGNFSVLVLLEATSTTVKE